MPDSSGKQNYPDLTIADTRFPRHPELLTDDVGLTGPQVLRCMNGCLFWYVKSRVLSVDSPIVAYLTRLT